MHAREAQRECVHMCTQVANMASTFISDYFTRIAPQCQNSVPGDHKAPAPKARPPTLTASRTLSTPHFAMIIALPRLRSI